MNINAATVLSVALRTVQCACAETGNFCHHKCAFHGMQLALGCREAVARGGVGSGASRVLGPITAAVSHARRARTAHPSLHPSTRAHAFCAKKFAGPGVLSGDGQDRT